MTASDWTLVVLAAGLGERYGGPKQLVPVGPSGELLSDYTLHDAFRAGAAGAVFVTRPDQAAALTAHHLRWTGRDLRYAMQHPPSLLDRNRPWGTTEAVLAARPQVHGPFVVVNADDYYGPEAVAAAGAAARAGQPAVVAWRLGDTYSTAGGVSRALLDLDAAGRLAGIVEGRNLTPDGPWPPDQPVSMNCWAFPPEVFPLLEDDLAAFLASGPGSPDAECALPETIGRLVAAGRLRVAVRPAGRGWFGITHPGDLPGVRSAVAALISAGRYPPSLPGPGPYYV